MTSIGDLREHFQHLGYKIVIAADGETRSHHRENGRVVEQTPAGGVGVAFDVICQAAGATYIARAKSAEDRDVVGPDNTVPVEGRHGSYTLKRIFLSDEQEDRYYTGFANQTLWPLCHVAFQQPIFNREWWEGYVEVNRMFAENIQAEIEEKTFVWINDYHLALVPAFLQPRDDTIISLFWHIPWPTWELFRILPYKREILRSFLSCDFVGFHRRYHARNFLNAVDRELAARINFETNTVYREDESVRVNSVPMGIDVDVIRQALTPDGHGQSMLGAIRSTFGFATSSNGSTSEEEDTLKDLSTRYRIMLGVDRLDYTKGIRERLKGLDRFFAQNPEYREKVVYIGIMSPTRGSVPAYQALHEEVEAMADDINAKYRTNEWEPLHMLYEGYGREEVMDLYRKSDLCLVTPVDDGMNLVSKEFVVAASCSDDPGVLVLSQFAGSAIDLAAALLVNPYDTDAVAAAIKQGLEMDGDERRERIRLMASLLEERNVYEWGLTFVRSAVTAAREQQLELSAIPL